MLFSALHCKRDRRKQSNRVFAICWHADVSLTTRPVLQLADNAKVDWPTHMHERTHARTHRNSDLSKVVWVGYIKRSPAPPALSPHSHVLSSPAASHLLCLPSLLFPSVFSLISPLPPLHYHGNHHLLPCFQASMQPTLLHPLPASPPCPGQPPLAEWRSPSPPPF